MPSHSTFDRDPRSLEWKTLTPYHPGLFSNTLKEDSSCLKFRGFFLFRNKIHVNAKIKSRDFFRITATLKFKSSEILNNFYQPQFSILVNHWVKILMREKFSVMSWYCQKTHGKTLDELVVKSCYVIVMYNEITETSCVVISGWKAYPSLNTPKI